MSEQLDQVIRYMNKLEAMINERDEWVGAYASYIIKRDVLRRYGVQNIPINEKEDFNKVIQELDERATHAETLFEGAEKDILQFVKVNNVEEARTVLIQLKSALNAYADKVGEEFKENHILPELSSEDILLIAIGMVNTDD